MTKINGEIDGSQQEGVGSGHGSQQDADAANRFSERMKRLWMALNVDSDAKLARALSLSQQTISSARTKKQIPSLWIIEVSENFGISADWVLYGIGNMRLQDHVTPSREEGTTTCLSSEDYVLVPMLESWVRGGPEGEIIFEGIADHFPFKKWWIDRLVGRSPKRHKLLYMVKVRGDSMTPTINHGESVLVDTYEPERMQVKTGDIYLVTMPDGATSIKRLAVSLNSDGRTRLICMSDNVGVYRPFDFILDSEKRIQDYVLAHVRWAGKEFE
ncbi:MAG: helix-turn-helix domain-containing protein [Desulfobacteraceae bacterium]|nr:helix-turn-helix domain-containing protein [Desulfobacteraceae bacterium]